MELEGGSGGIQPSSAPAEEGGFRKAAREGGGAEKGDADGSRHSRGSRAGILMTCRGNEYTQQYTQQATQSQLLLEDEATRFSDRREVAPPEPPQSWGKLIPSSPSLSQLDLDVRPPVRPLLPATLSFLELPLSPGDCFNSYALGRSKSCDVTFGKPDKRDPNAWVHTLVSNSHCRVYCMLAPLGDSNSGEHTMEVYVEDSSQNGTVVNRSTKLRRGERRLLNTGDEIGLVNESSLAKVPPEERRAVMSNYEFTFINVWQQAARAVPRPMPLQPLQNNLAPAAGAKPSPAPKAATAQPAPPPP
ncbi:hypothetical protein TeGR_g12864, partial [Tetraparma gracilis]